MIQHWAENGQNKLTLSLVLGPFSSAGFAVARTDFTRPSLVRHSLRTPILPSGRGDSV
jgi:hypothetical protein